MILYTPLDLLCYREGNPVLAQTIGTDKTIGTFAMSQDDLDIDLDAIQRRMDGAMNALKTEFASRHNR